MKKGELTQKWRAMSEESISGVAEWRQQHPKASFREIEAEVDQRLSEMRARMLSDAAIVSASADWEGSEESSWPILIIPIYVRNRCNPVH